jgi:hypothetical protein
MTKKDYIAIANGLKEIKRKVDCNIDTFNEVCYMLQKVFHIDNSNFNSERFDNYINDPNKHLKSYY